MHIFRAATLVCLGLGALMFAGLLVYPRFKTISQEPPAITPLTWATIARSLDDVYTVLQAWRARGLDRPDFRSAPGGIFDRISPRFQFFPVGDGMFPDEFQLRAWSAEDPDLRAYVGLPQTARSKDFYLVEPTGDFYWLSEYRYRRQPAPFHCAFILHLTLVEAAQTRIEVLEYLPTIWVGEKFGWSAHTVLPAFFHDLRVVGPTTTDRAIILKAVLALYGGPGGGPALGWSRLARPAIDAWQATESAEVVDEGWSVTPLVERADLVT